MNARNIFCLPTVVMLGVASLPSFADGFDKMANGVGVSIISAGITHESSGFGVLSPFFGFDKMDHGMVNAALVCPCYNKACPYEMLNGLVAAGLFNENGFWTCVNGIQVAGLANIFGQRCRLNGLQVGTVNVMGRSCEICGLQVGFEQIGVEWYSYGMTIGWENVGCSGAGILISAVGNFDGGLLKFTLDNFGGDANIRNITLRDEYAGVEIGCANVIGKMTGLQVGVFNVAESLAGVQVGLMNFAWNGKVKLLPLVNWAF